MVKSRRTNNKAVIEVDINQRSRNVNKNRKRNRRRRGVGNAIANDVSRSFGRGLFNSSLSRLGTTIGAGYNYMPNSSSYSMTQRGDVTVVARTEIMSEFLAAAAFTPNTVEQGALIPTNMPWLAGVAANFSKWRWVKLCLYYIPNTGTTTTGGIGFGYGYDMAESGPTSVADVVSYDQGYWGASWMPSEKKVEFDIGRVEKVWWPYIGQTVFNAITPKGSQNIYSPGYVAAAVDPSSITAGASLGFLWCDYVVELCDPIAAARQPQ